MNGNRLYVLGALAALVGVILITLRFSDGDAGKRVGVSGTVIRAGAPLEIGRIQFRPDAGTSGPVAWGDIERGRFRIPPGNGPVPGRYQVNVVVGPSMSEKLPIRSSGLSGKPAPTSRSVTLPDAVEIHGDSSKNDLELRLTH